MNIKGIKFSGNSTESNPNSNSANNGDIDDGVKTEVVLFFQRRLKFVVNATYFTVIHICKNILRSMKIKIIIVKTILKIT